MYYVSDLPTSSQSQSSVVNSKTCQVCGKPAAGQHYGIQSCHGCKSFFRRATIKNIRYVDCQFGETCYSNIFPGRNPSKCNKCRIKKCHKVGMVLHVLPNRDNVNNSLKLPAIKASNKLCIQNFVTKEDLVWGLIDQLSHLDLQIDNFRKSAYNPVFQPSLEQVILSPPQLSLAQKYGRMSGWPFTSEQFFERFMAMRAPCCTNNMGDIMAPPPAMNLDNNLKDWLNFDLMTSIEYTKTFSFFHQLSFNDKLALVEATTFMNLYLTSAFQSFSQNLDHIQMPDGISTPQMLVAITDSFEIGAMVQKQALRILAPMIRENMESSEYLLLKAVVLCNSAAPNLSPRGQRIIERERHKYCSALFHSCKIRFGVKNGPARFCSILSMSGILERLQKDFRELSLAIAMFIRDKLVPGDMPMDMPKTLQNELLKL